MYSRTPSEEQLSREDSAYQSQKMPHSRSSSVASLDHLDSRSVGESPECYADFKSHSLQGISSSLGYVRSNSQFDSHIAEMKGNNHLYVYFIYLYFILCLIFFTFLRIRFLFQLFLAIYVVDS